MQKPFKKKINDMDGKYERDEIDIDDAEKQIETRSYQERIDEALKGLEENKAAFLSPTALSTYSPKFLNILENLQDTEHQGLHLIYSQFRTLEGIGILKIVLETNGFAQFKIKQTGSSWSLDIKDEDIGKTKICIIYRDRKLLKKKEIMRKYIQWFYGIWSPQPSLSL